VRRTREFGFVLALILIWIGVSVGTYQWASSDDPTAMLVDRAVAAESGHGSEGTEATEHGATGGDDEVDHGEAEHAADAHAEGDHGGVHTHLPSFLDLIIGAIPGGEESTAGHYLKLFSPAIFGILIAIILAIVTHAATRSMTLVPGRLQNVAEVLFGGVSDFISELIGEKGRQFVPFLGTLFIYIWVMNLSGLVPLMMAPTSRVEMTAALALLVFLYVQYTNLRMNGVRGALYHLAGEPKDAVGWAMVPLMLPLHVIGELAKPFSLAVRLFGNIVGEDTLVAVFVGLGVTVLYLIPMPQLPLGLPIQIPFVFLGLLLSTIQALVFMLLATIYFSLVIPHDDHH